MSEGNCTGRRVNVWVQKFPDRPTLMLQWHDPETGTHRGGSVALPVVPAGESAPTPGLHPSTPDYTR
jgi:hypothetical protein